MAASESIQSWMVGAANLEKLLLQSPHNLNSAHSRAKMVILSNRNELSNTMFSKDFWILSQYFVICDVTNVALKSSSLLVCSPLIQTNCVIQWIVFMNWLMWIHVGWSIFQVSEKPHLHLQTSSHPGGLKLRLIPDQEGGLLINPLPNHAGTDFVLVTFLQQN